MQAMRSKTALLLVALWLLITMACGFSNTSPTTTANNSLHTLVPTYTPFPTHTPFPTYTPFPTPMPLPTYTPLPTIFPLISSIDLAHNTEFAEALNAYRVRNGQTELYMSYGLAYVAASRVQITMLSGIDMGQVQIDPKVMPQNYAWVEYTFGGDTAAALTVNTPQAALQHLLNRNDNFSADLLAPYHHDIGATLLCNGQRCGYVVILGRPNP